LKFWDSSAIVPLCVNEPASPRLHRLADGDPDIVVWWTTPVECTSAICRSRREDHIGLAEEAEAHARLDALRADWHEVQPSDVLREKARRLLRVHPVRAADALQLAAALLWSERYVLDALVALDRRLLETARLEGLQVVTVD
jgi:predicted nucleic acid-binding protein